MYSIDQHGPSITVQTNVVFVMQGQIIIKDILGSDLLDKVIIRYLVFT